VTVRRVHAALEDGPGDRAPSRRPLAGGAKDPDRPVDRDPRHDLAEDVMPGRGTALPNAVVRPLPALEHVLDHPADERAPVAAEASTQGFVQARPVEHLTVDVELVLGIRRVADPDGSAPFVAVEVAQGVLDQLPCVVDRVHDLQARGRAGARRLEKGAEAAALTAIPERRERVQHEGPVAKPAVAIVPVLIASRLLRQRGGWCGDERPRGRIGKRLER
jgi:hypothetical protein